MTGPEFGNAIRSEWPLDPHIAYLNHGTVGVTPIAVLEAEAAIRREIETNPSKHLLRDIGGLMNGGDGRLRKAAGEVARFLGTQPDDLVFVSNATEGVNAVLRSLPLAAGDAVLTTEHTYGGVRQAVWHACRSAGASVQVASLPCPIVDDEQILDSIAAAITPKTRLAVLDHIISETGVLLPLAEMVSLCHSRGIPVLVDGAHAPGQLDLDITAIGAEYYAANLHKWALAPRSTGILWVAPDQQAAIHPTVISWGLDEGLTAEFDWVGTRDTSPWLAAPTGIEFLERLDFERVQSYNHDLLWSAAETLCDRWHGGTVAPRAMSAFMTSVQLPDTLAADDDTASRLRDRLLFEHRIEVPVFAWGERLWARLSAQVYNDEDEFNRLGEAVDALSR